MGKRAQNKRGKLGPSYSSFIIRALTTRDRQTLDAYKRVRGIATDSGALAHLLSAYDKIQDESARMFSELSQLREAVGVLVANDALRAEAAKGTEAAMVKLRKLQKEHAFDALH